MAGISKMPCEHSKRPSLRFASEIFSNLQMSWFWKEWSEMYDDMIYFDVELIRRLEVILDGDAKLLRCKYPLASGKRLMVLLPSLF